jgi:phage-related protein
MKRIFAKFYRNKLGAEPVREFIKEFSKEDKIIIGTDIKIVEYGWPIGMPVCKSLGDGLYEVRSKVSHAREVRLIFCISLNSLILLHGFIKKTQKTPYKDLQLARRRKNEVM